jgi:hypothetical protein
MGSSMSADMGPLPRTWAALCPRPMSAAVRVAIRYIWVRRIHFGANVNSTTMFAAVKLQHDVDIGTSNACWYECLGFRVWGLGFRV